MSLAVDYSIFSPTRTFPPNSNLNPQARLFMRAQLTILYLFAAIASAVAMMPSTVSAKESVIKALLIDGQNNHQWQKTTPLIKATLESTGRFTVDVATTPAKGGDMSTFKPKFSDYQVVVSNYNGEAWSKETSAAFVEFVKNGGGFVSVHAADNSFPEWKEYNEMIAWVDGADATRRVARMCAGAMASLIVILNRAAAEATESDMRSK